MRVEAVVSPVRTFTGALGLAVALCVAPAVGPAEGFAVAAGHRSPDRAIPAGPATGSAVARLESATPLAGGGSQADDRFGRTKRFDDALDGYRSYYDKKLGVQLPGSIKVFGSKELQDDYDKAKSKAIKEAERKARKATKGMSPAKRRQAIRRATRVVDVPATLAMADLTSERKGRDRVPVCRIDVLPQLRSGDLTMAHELFHCYESFLAPKASNRLLWVREGLAEWAMTHFKGGPSAARESYRTYLNRLSKPLTSMDYDAVGFWSALEQVNGDGAVWARVKPVLLASGNAAAFGASGAGGGAFLDSWSSLSARVAPPGVLWQQAKPESIKGPGKLQVVSADTTLRSPAYVRVAATLRAPGGKPVIHVTSQQGHLRSGSTARDYGATTDKWFCASGECNCPEGTTRTGPDIEHLHGSPAYLGLTGGTGPGGSGVSFMTLEQWRKLFCVQQQVPTTISGTITGRSVRVPGPGTQDVKWEASVTFTRAYETRALNSEAFPISTRYGVTAFSGSVSPIPVTPNDTLCHSQSGSRPLSIADIDTAATGDAFQGAAFDPWGSAGRGPLYNMLVAPEFHSQPVVVGTELCPIDGSPPEVQPYAIQIPNPLLLTDGWSGLPSGAQPVADRDHFAGSYTYAAAGQEFTWTWDLRGSNYISVPKPN